MINHWRLTVAVIGVCILTAACSELQTVTASWCLSDYSQAEASEEAINQRDRRIGISIGYEIINPQAVRKTVRVEFPSHLRAQADELLESLETNDAELSGIGFSPDYLGGCPV